MKLAVLLAVLSASLATVAAEPAGQRRSTASPRPDPVEARGAQPVPAAPDKIAEAYGQFLLARHFKDAENIDGAIAAFKRAIELDPQAADVVAELASLYMQQNRFDEAVATGEQALKIAPANNEAHRVLGLIYAALSENRRPNASRAPGGRPDENVAKGIQHLEQALDRLVGEPDATARATLGRLYVRAGSYDKAISLLTELVNQEPGWQEGPQLLVEAYASAGRNADAIQWLEQAVEADPRLYATLADFFERDRRWKDAAGAFAEAVKAAPRNPDLKRRYAAALLNGGGRQAIGTARDVLTEVLATRPNDARALFLLSQAQRRLGDLTGAEATARTLIAQNIRSPWGFSALSEALEERRQYQSVVDTLSTALVQFRSSNDSSFELGLLLPHLGFAYQELGQFDKAIAAFDEAHRLSPEDPAITGYLIEANLAGKKYSMAADLARVARSQRPDDLRLARLEAQALRQTGKPDQGIAVLQDVVKKHADEPAAYVALAQLYSDASRGADAVQLLRDVEPKFPADTAIPFELGAVFDKQKRFADAEAAFHRVLARQPDNAAALNYLGYMLAERGERLDESVRYLKKALEIEPDNGSFLDSLGWAYYKSDKLDLALDNLRRAADQLKTNSVIQDHYGDVLFKLKRYDEAIAAWTRVLSGDGESIDRGGIDKKIRAAKQKLGKK